MNSFQRREDPNLYRPQQRRKRVLINMRPVVELTREGDSDIVIQINTLSRSHVTDSQRSTEYGTEGLARPI